MATGKKIDLSSAVSVLMATSLQAELEVQLLSGVEQDKLALGIAVPEKPYGSLAWISEEMGKDRGYNLNLLPMTLHIHYVDAARAANRQIGLVFGIEHMRPLCQYLTEVWGKTVEPKPSFPSHFWSAPTEERIQMVMGISPDRKRYIVTGYTYFSPDSV